MFRPVGIYRCKEMPWNSALYIGYQIESDPNRTTYAFESQNLYAAYCGCLHGQNT
jgi:hypothetical protein